MIKLAILSFLESLSLESDKMIYLNLYNVVSKKKFKKYFDTEFERDKFIRKLKYSSKLIVIN